MQFASSPRTRTLAALAAIGLFGGPAGAQAADPALIDRELAGGFDFRSDAYSGCRNVPSCTVNGLTISAERQTSDGLSWIAAQLYWDPVDGIGILDGAQHDEVDIDERLTVEFAAGTGPLRKIWFSDLFLGEDVRYGAAGNNTVEDVPDDVEVAGVALWSAGAEVLRFNVIGEIELPDHPFNQYISGQFLEDGDLRRRLLINNDIITVLSAGEGTGSSAIEINVVLGEVDKDKRGIFDGVETIEIDLSTILAGFHGTIMFPLGSHNFDMIQKLVTDPAALAALRASAVRERSVGTWSNGELGIETAADFPVDKVVFFSPFDSSNDFSIAGLLTKEVITDATKP